MQDIFKEGVHLKPFYRFIFPSIIQMVFMSINYIIDGILIANFLGINAFAALNLCYPVESLIWGLSVMPAAGAAALIAILLGEGKTEKANSRFTLICLVALGIGLLYTLVVYVFMEQILNLLGATGLLRENSRTYLMIANIGTPFAFLGVILGFFIRVDGSPRFTLLQNAAGGVALVGLDFLLMGKLGWGIEAPAIATLAWLVVKAVLGFWYFLRHNKTLKFVKPQWDGKFVRDSLVNGSSELVSESSAGLVAFVFNLLALHYVGEAGVAAIGIIMTVNFLLISLYFGYISGASPLISYYYGASEFKIVNTIHRWSKNLLLVSSVVIAGLTFIFAENLVSIYESNESEVFRIAVTGMRFLAAGLLFGGVNIYASGFFTAYGNGLISSIISFSHSIVFTLLFGLVFTAVMGFDGIWLSICTAEFLTLIISLVCFYIFRNKYRYSFFKS